jgi:hypothetical protein
MLHDFLTANRSVLIDRCRAMAASRYDPQVTAHEFAHGIPVFLGQLIETLVLEHPAGPSGKLSPTDDAALSATAALHGRDLFDEGLRCRSQWRFAEDPQSPRVRMCFHDRTPPSPAPLMAIHRNPKATNTPDAIALLKADHRQVRQLFLQFEHSRAASKRKHLVIEICDALTAHATMEEEIFYPAFLAGTRDVGMHHQAQIEHTGAKRLIAQIQAADPADYYYASKVIVLSEMIKHHVKEEERPAGMFAEARGCKKMDLKALGAQLAKRKKELMVELAE